MRAPSHAKHKHSTREHKLTKLLWAAAHLHGPHRWHLPRRFVYAVELQLSTHTPRSYREEQKQRGQLAKRATKITEHQQEVQRDLAYVAGRGQKRLLRHRLRIAKCLGQAHLIQLVNQQSAATGRTPLHAASEAGDLEIVRILLDKGADPYICDNGQVTPLMLAAANGHAKVVQVLIEKGGADPYQMCNKQRTALMYAASNGKVPCINVLLQVGQADVRQAADSDGWHALISAAAHGRLNALKCLIEQGKARVNQTDKAGNTALLLAARTGDTSMVQYLIKHGAKTSIAHFASGRTALHEAACLGHEHVLTALLESATTTDLQAQDSEGRTAFQVCGSTVLRDRILRRMQQLGLALSVPQS